MFEGDILRVEGKGEIMRGVVEEKRRGKKYL